MFIENEWTIGSIVKQLREERGISGAQLSRGLCSPATLSRIEAGEREMGLYFSSILFSRLGYYPDKFELYGSKEEYVQYEQRAVIWKLENQQDYGQISLELAKYRKNWEAAIKKEPLQQQFVNSIRGLLYVYENDGADCEQGIELLENAIALTMPEWSGKWYQDAVVSEVELNILSILADAYEVAGKQREALRIRRNIYAYLEKKPANRIQMLRLYTDVICKIIPELLQQNNPGQSLEMCEYGLNALSKRGRMYHWPDLLYWKGRCLESLYRIGKSEKSSVTAVYVRAYYIYRLFGNEEMAEKIKAHLEQEEPGWECIRLEML